MAVAGDKVRLLEMGAATVPGEDEVGEVEADAVRDGAEPSSTDRVCGGLGL